MESAEGGGDISIVKEEGYTEENRSFYLKGLALESQWERTRNQQEKGAAASSADAEETSHEGDIDTENAVSDELRLAMQHGGGEPEASKDFFVKAGAVYGAIAEILDQDPQENREQTLDEKA